jgi:initiation factor 1A
MVKNQKGGNKSKKMGRKFISAPVDRKIRLSQEDGEIYAVVTKNLGNGMFYANDCEGKERLCIMRRKFKGRGKRDNNVVLGCWVLIGEREFESCAKPKCDLLEVYNDIEKQKLKKSGDPIFSLLISDYDNKTDGDNIEEEFEFGNDETDKYKELLNSINNNDDENAVIEQKNKINIISTANDEDEEVDIDDI